MSRMMGAPLIEAKKQLRKQLKLRLAAMTDDDRQRQSQAIANKLFSMQEYRESKRVCLYLHMKEEVYTASILKHLLDAGRDCFIPQYIGPVMKMLQVRDWADYESLPETKWKIKQPPDDDVRPDALETGGLDLILMPGLGFTLAGDRIGRGKGYYDKFLQECAQKGFHPRTIALAYKEQICDEIPVSDDDKKVDVLLYPD